MANSSTIRGTNNPNYRHGGLVYYKREFNSWRAMKERCNDPKHTHYQYYGARGIKVCGRWINFQSFLDDMGLKPTQSHSLDRINVDGDYEPSNCRWATPAEQANNKRMYKTNKSGHTGICWDKAMNGWRVRVYIKGKREYLGCFKTIEEAVRTKENAIIKA